MYKENSIMVYITANTDAERVGWARTFGYIFPGSTMVQGEGVYKKFREKVTIVEHTAPPNTDPGEFRKLIEWSAKSLWRYKVSCGQEAVLMTVTYEGIRYSSGCMEKEEDLEQFLEYIGKLVKSPL